VQTNADPCSNFIWEIVFRRHARPVEIVYAPYDGPASVQCLCTSRREQRGNISQVIKDFDLKAEAIIRPWLSYICHSRWIVTFEINSRREIRPLQGYLAHNSQPLL
jgi:hypothetical protein